MNISNRHLPHPSVKAEGPSYAEQCDIWARSLTERQLRELAYDYLRTPEQQRDDMMIDAYREYERREAAGLLKLGETAESSKIAKKSRARNASRKKSR